MRSQIEAWFSDRRRGHRLQSIMSDVVWRIAGEADTVALVDASPQGFRIRTARAFEVGATVFVDLEDCTRLTAKVRWSRNGDYGCAFATRLPSGRFAQLLSCETVIGLPAKPGPHLQPVA